MVAIGKKTKEKHHAEEKEVLEFKAMKRKFLSYTVVRPHHVPVIYCGYSNASDSTLVE
jgi:hypothetical protein